MNVGVKIFCFLVLLFANVIVADLICMLKNWDRADETLTHIGFILICLILNTGSVLIYMALR